MRHVLPIKNPARLAIGAALLVVSAVTVNVARGDAADDAFVRGQKLAKEGAVADAEKAFEEAWSQRKSWDIAGNLGLTEAAQKKWDEAAEHLAYALGHIGGLAKPEQRRALEERLAEAKTQVATVTVRTSAGATVTVGPRLYKPLEGPLFLAPGTHSITASLEGFETSSATATVKAGEATEIAIELKPIAGATPTGSASSSGSSAVPPPPPKGEKPIWPPILLGGVAAVGVGLGVGFLAADAGKTSEADDLAAGCPTAPASCVTAGDDLLSTANTFRGVGIAGFGLAGAGLIGMVIVLALPAPSADENASLELAPVFGPTQQGFSLHGTF